MGCSSSKLEDEEAVQLCRDRRNFIKQAIEQRYRFALGHIAYLESLRRVSVAIINFAEGNEHHNFFADHCATPSFTPVTRLSPEILGIPLKSTTHVINCLRSGGNLSIPVEEWPGSPETVRIESFYPANHYGIDGFFTYEASQTNRPFASSPYSNRPSYPPASPQNSQWDFFWNPFSSLDQYRYQCSNADDDEMARLRKVREEEGIPELEVIGGKDKEEDDDDDDDDNDDDDDDEEENKVDENCKSDTRPNSVPVSDEKRSVEANRDGEKIHEVKECQTQGAESMQVSEARDTAEVDASARNSGRGGGGGGGETPAFTVYVNRRPMSMVEVVKDVDSQFVRIFDSSQEVSVMLEAIRAQYSASNEFTGARMLNPVALFRSPSSRSSSSRFLQTTVTSRDHDGDETNTNEECCTITRSHQSTLDRLYTWEKKLYEEVKCAERIRIAYEKKCAQLLKHDLNGEEPSVVDKTRAAIRDLHTRLKVSMHSVESVSRRIETLRDEELYPQLVELVKGLAKMWRTMADCHRIQKRMIDEAKLLLFSASSATASATLNMARISESSPLKPSKYATNLVFELRKWRSSLAAWINAQRSYARALAGWILRCARTQVNADDDQTSEESPHRTGTRAPPLFRLCVHWSRLLDSVSETPVIEGIDFFATGIGSVSTQQREGAAALAAEGAIMAVPEGMAEIGEKVLCAGMSAAVGPLTEFAASSAEGYEALVRKFEESGRAGRAEE